MVILLLLVGVLLLLETRGQDVVQLTPEQQALCESGYLSVDTGNPEQDCCKYYQCIAYGKAYLRTCAKPLVWNPKTCACDFRNKAAAQCKINLTLCYGENVVKETTCEDLVVPSNGCCVAGGIYILADDGEGYRKSNGGGTQDCPLGQLFNLDSCCCEGQTDTSSSAASRGDCIHFDFDEDYIDNAQGVYMHPGATQLVKPDLRRPNTKRILLFHNSTPAEIPYFSKVHAGHMATIAAWIRLDQVRGNIWDNGDSSETATFWFSLDPVPSPPTDTGAPGGPGGPGGRIGPEGDLRETITLLIKTGLKSRIMAIAIQTGTCPSEGCRDQEAGEWHHVAVVRDHDKVYVYVDGMLNRVQDTEPKVQTGTARPLSLGRGFTGAMDDFVMCTFAWTAEQVMVYVNVDDSIPTRS